MNRFTILCIIHPDTSVLLKDRALNNKSVEISCIEVNRECMLWCKHCYTNSCDHAAFVYYSSEFGMLQSLFRKPGCVCCCGTAIRRKLESKRNKLVGYIIGRFVAPLVAFLMFGMDLAPIYYSSLDGHWHGLLTQLFHLLPLAPVGIM